MTVTETAEVVARRYAKGAIENFKKDGYLQPTLILIGEQYVSMGFNGEASQDIQTAILDCLGIVMCTMDPEPTHVVMIMEGWIKHVQLPEGVTEEDVLAEMNQVHRGDFQREVEAGGHVDTGLVITCWDVGDLDASFGLTYTVEQDFHCEEIAGPQGGGINDVVTTCVKVARKARPHKPPEYTLALAARACQQWVDVWALGLTAEQSAEDFGFPPKPADEDA